MCTTIRHFTDLLLEDLGQLVELHQRKPRTLSQYFGTAHHYFCLPVRGTQTLFECDVTTIAVAEVREWHRACALKARSSGTPGAKQGTTMANRALALLCLVFNRAEEDGAIPLGAAPTKHVQRFRELPRRRYLAPVELSTIWAAIARAERRRVRKATRFDEPYVHSVTQALRLILLLALRKEEALGLTWAQVDFDQQLLRLAETKTGEREVPLSTVAVRLLRQQESRHASPWVFPGRGGRAPVRDVYAVWREVLADCGLEGQGIVPHTARHSLATLELQAGRSVEDVMAILGHSSPSVTLNIYGRRLATPGARASAERHGLRMRRAA